MHRVETVMISEYSPVVHALLGGLFTWGLTAAGAAAVFMFKEMKRKLLDVSLGFAAGVMTAASFWSLLEPAIQILTVQYQRLAFLGVAVGFAAGAAFVWAADQLLLPALGIHDHSDMTSMIIETDTVTKPSTPPSTPVRNTFDNKLRQSPSETENCSGVRRRRPVQSGESLDTSEMKEGSWHRILLLIIAITVHNIPEGLAVGVGFGAVNKTPSATFEGAATLALGIGIQNFPEGLAVSLPLAAFGFSKWRSFWYGQLSGMVEPISAVIGAGAVSYAEPLLPYALSFAAGAMIYVVVDDIIPEANTHGNGKLASLGAIVGFIVMMSLDVGLG